MRIAITGANGFVGKALCPYLAQTLNADIVSITRSATHGDAPNLSQTDKELISQLNNIDCLIHLASRAHTHGSTQQDFERDNIDLSERIGKICTAAKIPRLIYLSSIKVNGNSTTYRAPYSASEAPMPEDDYGKSKLASENILKSITNNTQTNLVIIRPPLVYGDKNKGNLKTLVRLIKSGIPLPFAALTNKRDLVSVENLCSLIATCVQHTDACNHTFLVSDGISRSTSDIIKLLCTREQLTCKQFPVPFFIYNSLKYLKPFKNQIESLTGDLQVDITQTQAILGWQPR